MKDVYILYNPRAGDGRSREVALCLSKKYPDANVEVLDATRIFDFKKFTMGLDERTSIILCGGDGTINYFINNISKRDIGYGLFYYPTGSGNDFLRDLGKTPDDCPVRINEYVKSLPSVTVKDKRYSFINGVGFGIDGYCCEEGDKLKAAGKTKVNYTSIAIKGLLLKYKTTSATVEVDGEVHTFKRVWLAPTMHGRYYGGGMIPAPVQSRDSGKLSVMLFHGAGRFRTLCFFPGIFKGKHVKHKRMVAVHTGHEITVEFDRPTPLQIDGETIPDVTKYTARSAAYNRKRKEKNKRSPGMEKPYRGKGSAP